MAVTNPYYERSISTGDVIPQSEFELLQTAFDNVETGISEQVAVDYTYEKSVNITPSGGAITLDLAGPSVFYVTLTENITTINTLNWPVAGLTARAVVIFTQNGVAGHSVSWGVVKFTGGAPTIGANPGDSTIITMFSSAAGSTIYGVSAGVAPA